MSHEAAVYTYSNTVLYNNTDDRPTGMLSYRTVLGRAKEKKEHTWFINK
jgi:hypothetical protein